MIGSDDAILIKKAAKGNESAFEQLVTKYQNMVYRLCLSKLRSRVDAMEAAQDVFLKMWKSLGDFRYDSSLSTWIYRITQNTLTDQLRRQTHSAAMISTDDEESDRIRLEEEDPSTRPDRMFENIERKRILKKTISELSDEHREMILLHDIDGYSYKEIAEITGLSEGTVKSRSARAREKLKELLVKRDYF